MRTGEVIRKSITDALVKGNPDAWNRNMVFHAIYGWNKLLALLPAVGCFDIVETMYQLCAVGCFTHDDEEKIKLSKHLIGCILHLFEEDNVEKTTRVEYVKSWFIGRVVDEACLEYMRLFRVNCLVETVRADLVF